MDMMDATYTESMPLEISTTDATWEYTYIEVEVGRLKAMMHTINQAGSEGWELVSTAPAALGGHMRDAALTTMLLLLFKRRRQPQR